MGHNYKIICFSLIKKRLFLKKKKKNKTKKQKKKKKNNNNNKKQNNNNNKKHATRFKQKNWNLVLANMHFYFDYVDLIRIVWRHKCRKQPVQTVFKLS